MTTWPASPEVVVGGNRFTDVAAIVTDLSFVAPEDPSGRPVNALLGWPVLGRLALTLDRGRGRIGIAASADSAGQPLLVRDQVYVPVRTGEGRQALMLPDTGANTTTLNERAAERLGLAREEERTVDVAGGAGKAKQAVTALAEPLELQLSGASMTFPAMMVDPVDPGEERCGVPVRPDGILGVDAFGGGVAVIDGPGGALRLSPAGSPPAP